MSQTQAEFYKDGTITAADLATNSVTETKVQDGAISRAKLADAVKPTPFTTRGFDLPL
jgi:hypothetical protein